MEIKIDAVGVTSSDLKKTVRFYELLGFEFGEFKDDEQHLEPVNKPGSARLMIDTKELIKDILGEEPKPSNHSVFAILCENPNGVDAIVEMVKVAGFKVVKEPWDAFWGQRYAIIEDPDGYKIDLFANLG